MLGLNSWFHGFNVAFESRSLFVDIQVSFSQLRIIRIKISLATRHFKIIDLGCSKPGNGALPERVEASRYWEFDSRTSLGEQVFSHASAFVFAAK